MTNELLLRSYTDKSQRGSEIESLLQAEASALTSGPMNPSTRLAVLIPAHHQERRLSDTLRQYRRQTLQGTGRFEIVVLINGPVGVNLETSPAYQQAANVQRELHATVAFKNYSEREQSIGKIRDDLALLALRRANLSQIDSSRLIVVTNDADLIQMKTNYLERVLKKFDDSPDLSAMSGPYKYSNEELALDHRLLAAQRLEDVMQMIIRRERGHFPLYGGNSAFRVNDFMEVGGHGRRKVGVNRDLRKKLQRSGKHIGFSWAMQVVTSGRRHQAALASNIPVMERHRTFGRKGDINSHYLKPSEAIILPEIGTKVTSPNFPQALNPEFQAEYDKLLGAAMFRNGLPYGTKISESIGSMPEEVAKSQEYMSRAAAILGIKLCFKGEKVYVKGIGKFRDTVIRRYSGHF